MQIAKDCGNEVVPNGFSFQEKYKFSCESRQLCEMRWKENHLPTERVKML